MLVITDILYFFFILLTNIFPPETDAAVFFTSFGIAIVYVAL